MLDSVRFDREQHVQFPSLESSDGAASEERSPTPQFLNGKILCSHDGVLLRKASVEHIADLSVSGSLSVVEYHSPPRIYIEWRPNENILIADDSQDQGDWALVDTISQRTRTTSECKVFNTKPNESNSSNRSRIIRTHVDEFSCLLVKHRNQVLCFLRKSDNSVHSEYFFQHGNAEIFVHSMCQLHIIEQAPTSRNGEEYVILNTEDRKLKRTFAELKIGDMKSKEGWLSHRVAGLFVTLPDLSPALKGHSPKKLQHSSQRANENYQLVGMSGANSGSSGTQSSGSSLDKSPIDNELENGKEQNEKVINILPDRPTVTRGPPLTEAQWLEFQTPDGCISDSTRIKEIIFRGGIHYDLRAEVWKYLLNYYQWNDTELERIQRHKQKSLEYYKMKAQWLSMTSVQEANFSGFRDRKCQIEKDVKRTDRTQDFFAGEDNPNLQVLQGILMTYVMYNFDLGYVQGMSDLLAPILAVQGNEVDAFWCFVGFMDMVFSNFDIDQAGMKTQFEQLRRLLEFTNPRLFNYMLAHDSDNMYFCFRWLVVWYKREFSNDDVLKLWECLWTRLPCPNFHIFISLAILDQETDTIIECNYEFTEILKHVNELSGNIDVKRTLEIAEAIYLQVKAVDNLPNEIRKIIGEPLVETQNGKESENANEQHDLDDEHYEIVHELTPEERQRQEKEFEEACERSMFLQFI